MPTSSASAITSPSPEDAYKFSLGQAVEEDYKARPIDGAQVIRWT